MLMPMFPSTGSIPPPCFYTPQGLAGWLNLNPIPWKDYFSYTGFFDNLIPTSFAPSSLSSIGYNPYTVPLCSNVQLLSQGQGRKYSEQLGLFQKVYGYNSNAYVTSLTIGNSPVYYNFFSNQERSEYNSAVALVNKLYSFKAMGEVGWIIPFPLGM